MVYNLDLEACTNKVFWDIAANPKPFNLLQSGTRTGKTVAMAQLIYIIACKYQNQPLKLSAISESMPHIKRGLKYDFFQFLKKYNLEPKWNENKTDSTYRKGNFTIEFFSVDSSDKVHGASRDFLFGNEIQNLKYDTVFQLIQRTNIRSYFDYNPTHKFWIFDKFIENNDFKNDIKLVRSSIFDNKFLSPNILKSVLARAKNDENYKRVYLDGEIGSVEGLVFKNFKTVNEIDSKFKLLGYGVDFGFNDPMTLIACYRFENQLLFHELFYESEKITKDLINFVIKNNLTGYLFCDSARKDSIQEIKNNGIKAVGARKYPGCIKDRIDLIKSFDVSITASSLNLIKEFRSYSYIKTKDGVFIDEPIDDFNHGIDALGYCVQEVLTKPKLKPHKIL